VALG